MALVTLAEVLTMPSVREAAPEVLAGHAHLDGEVRWAHATELADIAPLLRGGDLLLSTGIALPETFDELHSFAASLKECSAAGLFVELGRRWDEVPEHLVQACEEVGLPLVALAQEVRFAAITQAVGERVVDEQLAALRQSQRVHDTFTELSIAEAGPLEILEATQQLSGAAVVLESDEHQVLDYRAGPDDVTAFLADWSRRSRSALVDGRTGWHQRNGWLVTRLGKRGRDWGRLIIQSPTPPTERLVAVAERAAAAFALHQLHARHRDTLVRRLHHELILGLLADPNDAEIIRRCELAGFPTRRRTFVGLTVRPVLTGRSQGVDTEEPTVEDVIAQVAHHTHGSRTPALVCEVDRDVRILLAIPSSSDADRVANEIAARIARRHRALISAGRRADDISEADRTLREAQHVISSIRTGSPGPFVHRLEDVHLRGLLALLTDDDRLRLFVSRELTVLKVHDQQRGTELVRSLRAVLTYPGNKSEAAKSLHISRPVLYDRVSKVENLLHVDLDDPEIRVSLHVALMADELGFS